MLTVLGALAVWGIFLRDLPDIRMIERGGFFTESTVIYDKDGNEIYSFSESGKRTYVPYELISQPIKDALVSMEDQRFFENPGVDILGLIRAGLDHYVLGKGSRVSGTSTLSQQLVKNTLLTNERSLKRKIQEAYLAYQLNQTYSKEKILEMYLNAIEFGHNANGVEQASRTFFGKSAKDVGVLGATILASLPKSPTVYSPYLYRDRLMGKIEAFAVDSPSQRVVLSLESANGEYAPVYHVLRQYVQNLTYEPTGSQVRVCHLNPQYTFNESLRPDASGCRTVNYTELMALIGSIRVTGDLAIGGDPSEPYSLEYTVGRKDFVASRMFEDGKIDGPTFGKVIFDGLEFQFERPTSNIKYPYFVMYVKEYLETTYGKDINIQNGLRVYTTIDPKLQEYAEQVVRDQVATNKGRF